MKLVFASNNPYKLQEIKDKAGQEILITSLDQEGITEEIPETQQTIEGNARQKAEFIYQKYGFNCFADDTGLEIDALNGAPGVYSARYAGVGCTFQDNIRKVLKELGGIENRKARFRTVICLIIKGKTKLFEGIAEGEITKDFRGEKGFGYDPVFLPLNSKQTFAEMPLAEKNKMSHRSIAISKLIEYLHTIK